MLILLSPAKTLDYERSIAVPEVSQPILLEHSAVLIDELKQCSPENVARLMKISPALAELNVQRFQEWHFPFTTDNAKAAVMAFKGDVYQGLDAETLLPEELSFAQKHVRILSGLYGVLRPLDLTQAYRLEMGTTFNNQRGKNLYEFWGESITDVLNGDLQQQGSSVVINLASNEYFKSVQKKKLQGTLVTPIFKDEKNGQFKIISFFAKKARGLMARWLIQQQQTLQTAAAVQEALQSFSVAGYRYCAEESTAGDLVFKRSEEDRTHE